MHKPSVAAFFACLALGLVSLLARAQTIPPGEYIMERGGGTLKVFPPVKQAQNFSIESLGANGHSCSLEGDLRKLKANVETEKGEPPCLIDFTLKGADVGVDPKTQEACRTFCGMRAWFEGTYLKPAPGCAEKEVAKARAGFKRLYDKKDYEQARSALAPLLTTCAKTLYETDEYDIRNDLAVTLYHLGKMAECRDVLDGIGDLAGMSDEEVHSSFPPTDADVRAPIARAARTNLKLCGGSRKK